MRMGGVGREDGGRRGGWRLPSGNGMLEGNEREERVFRAKAGPKKHGSLSPSCTLNPLIRHGVFAHPLWRGRIPELTLLFYWLRVQRRHKGQGTSTLRECCWVVGWLMTKTRCCCSHGDNVGPTRTCDTHRKLLFSRTTKKKTDLGQQHEPPDFYIFKRMFPCIHTQRRQRRSMCMQVEHGPSVLNPSLVKALADPRTMSLVANAFSTASSHLGLLF